MIKNANTNVDYVCINPREIFGKICQLHLPLTAPLEHPYTYYCFTMFHN